MTLERRGDGLDYWSARRSRERAQFKATNISAERATRQILDACRHGDAELVTTIQAERAAGHSPSAVVPPDRRAEIIVNSMAAARHVTLNGAPALLHLHGDRRGCLAAGALVRARSAERAKRHRLAQLCQRRDVMFVRLRRDRHCFAQVSPLIVRSARRRASATAIAATSACRAPL